MPALLTSGSTASLARTPWRGNPCRSGLARTTLTPGDPKGPGQPGPTKPTLRHSRAACLLHVIGVLLLLALPGCKTEERVIHDTWAQFRAIGDQNAPPPPDGDERPGYLPPRSAQQQFAYAIALTPFTGAQQTDQARQLLHRLEKEFHIPDLWSRAEGEQTVVYRGRYDQKNDPRAVNALRQMKLLNLDGALPFEHAAITRLALAPLTTTSEMDLKQYAGRGLFSLQVEVYDENLGPSFRQFAQQRAAELRQQGEPAYYYHGRFRSMVTLGLLTEEEAFVPRIGQAAAYSPAVLDMQKRFPHNVFNGSTIVEKSGGASLGEQPSFLVPVN